MKIVLSQQPSHTRYERDSVLTGSRFAVTSSPGPPEAPRAKKTPPLKVLFLTRYGRQAASSRQRCHLYLEALAAAGITAQVSPFLNDRYVRNLHAGERLSRIDILQSYLVRLGTLLRLYRYDAVWIEKEALPWLPGRIETALFRMAGVPIVVDYDDATFHAYDGHRVRLVRALLGRKIDRIMAAAALVIAGNPYLAARAAAAGARSVAQLPTAVDTRCYLRGRRERSREEGRTVTIGWIGSPATSAYVEVLRAPLAELAGKFPLRLRLIGADTQRLSGLPVDIVPWSIETEAVELARCDIGIMPLPDRPWERGKCGYKLIQYMASGLPVVASPVGANCDIVVSGKTGFLAGGATEWLESLSLLCQDRELRERMGVAGRNRAERLYSVEVTAPRFIGLLRSAAELRTRHGQNASA